MQTRFAKMFLKRMFKKSKFEFLYFLPTLPFPQNILKLWEEKQYQIFVVVVRKENFLSILGMHILK